MTFIRNILLAGVSGCAAIASASAADLAVTKPAPAEYVRICSEEGNGFFYIPGTETCLQIGGWVQLDVDFNSNQFGIDQFGFDFEPAARLTFDARTETALGKLRSFVALETYGTRDPDDATGATSSDELVIDRAFVQLGGFIAGRADTFFGFDDPMPYTLYSAADLIGYTATFGSGFYAGLSAEHPVGLGFVDPDETLGRLVGNVGYKGDGLRVQLAGNIGRIEDDTTFGANLQARYELSTGTTLFASASYLDNGVARSRGRADYEYRADSDTFIVTARIDQKFGDFTGYVGAAYFSSDVAGVDWDGYAIRAGAIYNIVPGFSFRPEVTYFNESRPTEVDGYVGRLRFRRSF
jgi:hypothetical protein